MKKRIVILFVVFATLLTGCVRTNGGGTGHGSNLSDTEIIRQIQEKMKLEMDKIGFEVDFNQYEFHTELHQSLASSGRVFMRDKRYNYEPIVVYEGQFGYVEQDKVAYNPIIFIFGGLANYLDNKYSVQKNAIEMFLKKKILVLN